jgi:CRP-like cAMP-binding protein
LTQELDQKAIVDALRGVSLFSDLSDKHLRLIAQQSKHVRFDPGTEICSEGQTGIGMHIVVEGDTAASVGGQEVRKMGPGAFFGEVALLDGGPRSATVTAESEVHTVSIPSWNFNNLLKEYPEMTLALLKVVAQRLRERDQPVEG